MARTAHGPVEVGSAPAGGNDATDSITLPLHNPWNGHSESDEIVA